MSENLKTIIVFLLLYLVLTIPLPYYVYAGGGTIDLVQNNKITSFDAVSAEAEVITE